jgi:hypothetical protein
MRNVFRFAQLVFVLGFAVIYGGTALADDDTDGRSANARLHGAYAFSYARTCTVSPAQFIGPALAIPSGVAVFRQSASDAGIMTFNGDGTGTVVGRTESMNLTSLAGSFISVFDITGTFTYTVNPDGTVDTASTTNAVTVFPPGGPTTTVTGQVGRFQIAHGGTLLVSAPAGNQPTVEVIAFSTTPNPQYRICVRNRTAVKFLKD